MTKSFITVLILSMPLTFAASKDHENLDKQLARTLVKLNQSNSKKLTKYYYSKLYKIMDKIRNSKELISPKIDRLNIKN